MKTKQRNINIHMIATLSVAIILTIVGLSSFILHSSAEVGLSEFLNNKLTLKEFELEAPDTEAYSQAEIALQKSLNAQEIAIVTEDGNHKNEYLEIDHEEITPYTWKWVKFEVIKDNGLTSLVELRRPNWWIKKHHADIIGQEIDLFIPELGITNRGTAKVLEIAPNYLDTRFWDSSSNEHAAKKPIIGRYVHESDDVWAFTFDHIETPIEATANHPFWSLDRNDWIDVGDLQIGERVKARNIETKLLSKKELVGLQKVYNLEVYQNHNFHISENALLVHNSDPKKCPPKDSNKPSANLGKTIVESQEATKVYSKLQPGLKKKVDDIVMKIRKGEAGGNKHALVGDLQGYTARDIKGSGKGRGFLRIVYKVTDNDVYIHQIINYHTTK